MGLCSWPSLSVVALVATWFAVATVEAQFHPDLQNILDKENKHRNNNNKTLKQIHNPPFSWDTVPIYFHGCNTSGAFSEVALDTLTKFALIIIEKGQGMNATTPGWYAEDYQLQAAMQIKSRNPSIHVSWYWNSVLDWILYRMHYQFLNHSEWWMRNCTGSVIHLSGDKTFAQPPQGMLAWDLSQIDCANWWASKCLNMTNSGYFDGCNADRVYQTTINGICNDTSVKYKNNKFSVLENLQLQLNETNKGILWINYGQGLPGVRGLSFEGWGNFEGAIWDMNNATKEGFMIHAHSGYCVDGTNCGCNGQSLINNLATFLVCAKQYTYFTCNENWFINDTTFNYYDEYDKPLGAPMQENGVKVDDTYYRSFATGTAAIFNVSSRQGRIFWSDEWDNALLKRLRDRIDDWDKNIHSNYQGVDKRRQYFDQFDILL